MNRMSSWHRFLYLLPCMSLWPPPNIWMPIGDSGLQNRGLQQFASSSAGFSMNGAKNTNTGTNSSQVPLFHPAPDTASHNAPPPSLQEQLFGDMGLPGVEEDPSMNLFHSQFIGSSSIFPHYYV